MPYYQVSSSPPIKCTVIPSIIQSWQIHEGREAIDLVCISTDTFTCKKESQSQIRTTTTDTTVSISYFNKKKNRCETSTCIHHHFHNHNIYLLQKINASSKSNMNIKTQKIYYSTYIFIVHNNHFIAQQGNQIRSIYHLPRPRPRPRPLPPRPRP